MPVRTCPVVLLACAAGLSFAGSAGASPTLSVAPSSAARDSTAEIRVEVGGLLGSEAILRLRADVDGDGLADPGEQVLWTGRLAARKVLGLKRLILRRTKGHSAFYTTGHSIIQV